jgi:rare lipoprotein A
MSFYLQFLFGAKQRASIAVLLSMLITLAGCAQQSVRPATPGSGGMAQRSSGDTVPPPAFAEDNTDHGADEGTDDATSRPLETISGEPNPSTPTDAGASSSVAGCACGASFAQTGMATWYGNQFHGRRTASGERFDMHALTAAHRTLPLGACVRVTALGSARSVIVRINDRGPFVRGRVIDLSYAAAQALGVVSAGSAQVKLERVAAARQASGGRVCSERGA